MPADRLKEIIVNGTESALLPTSKAEAASRVAKKYEEALRMLADEEYAQQMEATRSVIAENRDVLRKHSE
ncbi:MAG TPA: hypothetical protein VMD29_07940 [Terracidiphilus sp.]|nr:hypothetical protein [Terracidiphilus sp.]